MRKLILIGFLVSLIPFLSAGFGIDNPNLPRLEPSSTIIINGSGTGGNLTTFLELTDTPSTYTGQSNKCIRVNNGESALEFFVCPSGGSGGWVGTAESDLNMAGYQITNIGGVVMSGLINSQNIIPLTDNLYSLGNTTNRYGEVHAVDIYSDNITTSNLNSNDGTINNLNSQQVTSTTINSTDTNTDNLSVGGARVYVVEGVTFYKGVN